VTNIVIDDPIILKAIALLAEAGGYVTYFKKELGRSAENAHYGLVAKFLIKGLRSEVESNADFAASEAGQQVLALCDQFFASAEYEASREGRA
jgi:hypothetical protein